METKYQVVFGGPPRGHQGIDFEEGRLGLGDDATKLGFKTVFERCAGGSQQGGKGAVLGDGEMHFLGVGAPEAGLVNNVLVRLFLLPRVWFGSLKLVTRQGRSEHQDTSGGRTLTDGRLGGDKVDDVVQGQVGAVGNDGLDHPQLIFTARRFGLSGGVWGLGLRVLGSAGLAKISLITDQKL